MSDDAPKPEVVNLTPGAGSSPVRVEELPVVARLVVEIRSDGSQTIARGAYEDQLTGQNVAVQAQGTTPQSLAASMAQELAKLPLLAVGMAAAGGRRAMAKELALKAVKRLLPGKK